MQWGHAIYDLVETIRSESARLATHAGLFAREEAEASELDAFRQLVAKPGDVAPNYIGSTYEGALKLVTGVAQEFLAGYLGRDGAKPMSAEELIARRKRIDAKIAQLAETEKATIARKEAELQELATEGA